ncbi:MAG: DUF4340 domain-containing protein [Pseudomonadota bacterium]
MMRKLWLNLGAAALLFAALAAVSWLTRTSTPVGSEALRLTALSPGTVKDIQIQRQDGSLVALTRNGDFWRVTEPFAARANPVRAAAIASLAGATTNVFYPVAAIPLAEAGLAPPQLVVALNGTALEIGARQSLDDLRYVRVEQRVALLKDHFFHHLDQPAAGFVHPAPLPPGANVKAIRAEAFELKLGAGKWTWAPSEFAVSADAVVTLVSRWQAASATAVMAMDPAVKWRDNIAVTLSTGDVLQFKVREAGEHGWLGLPALNLQYQFPRTRIRQLFEAGQSERIRGRGAGDLRARAARS